MRPRVARREPRREVVVWPHLWIREATRGPTPSIRQVIMLPVRPASSTEALKWDTMKGRRRPIEVLKPCWMKDTMKEASTIVHPRQPPSLFLSSSMAVFHMATFLISFPCTERN